MIAEIEGGMAFSIDPNRQSCPLSQGPSDFLVYLLLENLKIGLRRLAPTLEGKKALGQEKKDKE